MPPGAFGEIADRPTGDPEHEDDLDVRGAGQHGDESAEQATGECPDPEPVDAIMDCHAPILGRPGESAHG